MDLPSRRFSCDHSEMQEFTDLGLSDAMVQAFAALGFETPTDIQKLAMPAINRRQDVYISSATGTGKTFAYAAPVLDSIDCSARTVQAIVVTPTHDLAAQIHRELSRLAAAATIAARVEVALGSIPLKRQLDRLAERPHIVVGSAGRIRDLALAGDLDLSGCLWAILDEADRLFENEAIDITTELLNVLPAGCARVLVSATLPKRTVDRSAPWFRDPVHLSIDSSEALRTSIEHWCFHSPSRSKLDFLRRFESSVKPERCLLFASSNATVFTIQKRLDFLGFPAVVLKSDKDGTERKNALEEFSSGAARWLITTDLGARGLDLPDVSHVISFDLPEEPTVYMHRAGRTGRAGKHGVSVALTDLVELKRASKIAVKYGFPFVCKILDSGIVHDIEPENFFALAEEEESARKDVKLEGSKRPDPRRRVRSPGDRPTGRTGDREGTRGAGRTSARPMARSSAGSGMPPRSSESPQPFGVSPQRSGAPSSQRSRREPDRSREPRPSMGSARTHVKRTPPGPADTGHGSIPPASQPAGVPPQPQASKRHHRRHKSGPKDATKPASE
jgi:superfamily II DNA/RNA helicase